MVNPDLGGGFNVDEILALGSTVELEVTDNDVGSLEEAETTVSDSGVLAYTEDGGAGDIEADNAAAGERALDLDDTSDFGGSSQASAVGDSGTGSTSSSCGASTKTNKLVNGGSALLHGGAIGSGSSCQSHSGSLKKTHLDVFTGNGLKSKRRRIDTGCKD